MIVVQKMSLYSKGVIFALFRQHIDSVMSHYHFVVVVQKNIYMLGGYYKMPKIVFLTALDCTDYELQNISHGLSNLARSCGYEFIISNKEFQSITLEEFEQLIERFKKIA